MRSKSRRQIWTSHVHSWIGLDGRPVKGREGEGGPLGRKWASEPLSARLSTLSPAAQSAGPGKDALCCRILTHVLIHPKSLSQFRKSHPIMKMYTLAKGKALKPNRLPGAH